MNKNLFDDAAKKVIRGLPFYSYIYAKTKKIYSDIFEAAAGITIDKTTARPIMILNRKKIEELIEKCEISEAEAPLFIAGIIQHELDHYILGHVFKNPKSVYGKLANIYNISADSSINRYLDIIKNLSGNPEDYFEGDRSKHFFAGSREMSDFTAESLFNSLLKYVDKDNSGQSEGEGSPQECTEEEENAMDADSRGGLDSHGGFGASGDIKEAAENFRDAIIKESVQKSRGLIPGHLQQFVNDILKGKINWKRELKRFTGKGVLGRRVETMMRQNRRFEDQPGHRIDEEGKIGVILDTSGSMSYEELKQAFSEIDRLTMRQRKFYLIQYDANVTGIDKYRRGAWKKIKIKGRGGTDMRPALLKMMEMRIKRIVSITDGWDDYNYDLLKNFKVLFLLTKNHNESFKETANSQGFKTLIMED